MTHIIFTSIDTIYHPHYQAPNIYKKLYDKLEMLKRKKSITLIYVEDKIPKLANSIVISMNENIYKHGYPHYQVDHPGDTYFLLSRLYP